MADVGFVSAMLAAPELRPCITGCTLRCAKPFGYHSIPGLVSMTEDEPRAVPEERGELGPPSPVPPIALGAATGPPPEHGRAPEGPLFTRLRHFVDDVLEFADALVDAVRREWQQRMR